MMHDAVYSYYYYNTTMFKIIMEKGEEFTGL